MIILLIILFAAFVIIGFFYVKGAASWIVGSLSMLLLALSMIALAYHDQTNWGMKEVTTTSTHQIYTAGDKTAPYGLMIKAEIGQNTGNYVLVFRNNANSAKPDTNFEPNQNNIVESVKKSATYQLTDTTTAKVQTTTTRLEFSSNLMKLLFGIGGEQNTLVKQHSVVSVPQDTWLVLTQSQVETLTKKAPQMQAQMEAELKANPAKALQLAELQKSNPKEYAKMQVEQIKQLLGIKD